MHPSFDILSSESVKLSGKTIVLAVSGSIAALRSFGLCRLLIRHGAVVKVVMSNEATKILAPEAMHYASGIPAITEITGAVEHIEFFGSNGCADLLLIAPSTANTIGKIAQGIDDTPITTFATTALGSKKPVLIVPAMHQSMYSHSIVQENIKKLEKIGVRFLCPKLKEHKAKLPNNKETILEVFRILGSNKLKNKKILIASGAVQQPIDPIRILTTKSSGKMGREIARAAYSEGADVTIVHPDRIEKQIKSLHIESFGELRSAIFNKLKNKRYGYFISAAAIPDFSTVPKKDKIKSGKRIMLKMLPTKKIIFEVRKKYPKLKIVAFKAETNKPKKELEEIARDFMKKNSLQMVVANDVAKGTLGKDAAEVLVVTKNANSRTVAGSKQFVAEKIISLLP